jgi:hypothetical protein
MRAIVTLVSYGHPSVHQISNCEEVRTARRMQPYRPVVLGHQVEQGQELRRGERRAVHVGEHLHAACAELRDRPARLRERCVGIVESDRRHEARKAVRVSTDEVCESVVADPRQIRRFTRTGESFDGRRRHRQNLLIVAEPIHHPEARIEIVECRDIPDPLPHVLVLRGNLDHFFEIPLRKEVIEHVQLAHADAPPGESRRYVTRSPGVASDTVQ